MGNTPATGWHWNITPEQIERIKANDRETIDKVYAENMKKFRAIGCGFCRRARCFDCYEDFLQQIYVDLRIYDYTDTKKFYYSLKRSFHRARLYNGREISLETELCGDEEYTLADTVADDFNIDEYVTTAETVKETAPEAFSLLNEILFRGNPQARFDNSKINKLRDIIEYIYVGYTFEQIQGYARGMQ